MIFRNSSHCESWAPSGGPTTQLTTAVRTVGHSGRCMLRGIQCAEGSAYMDCYPPFHKALYYPKLSRVPCLLPLYTILSIPPSPLSFLEFLLPPLCFSVAATAVAYFTTSTQGHIKISLNKNQWFTVAGLCCRLVIQVYGRLTFADGLTLIQCMH